MSESKDTSNGNVAVEAKLVGSEKVVRPADPNNEKQHDPESVSVCMPDIVVEMAENMDTRKGNISLDPDTSSVADVAEAKPSVAVVAAAKPSVVVVAAAKPSVAVVAAAKPSVAVVAAAKPSVAVVAAAKPSVAVVAAAKPSAAVVAAAKPSAAVVAAAKPSGEDVEATKLDTATDTSTQANTVIATDDISILSLKSADDSENEQPPTCFGWIKKYGSPQRFMSSEVKEATKLNEAMDISTQVNTEIAADGISILSLKGSDDSENDQPPKCFSWIKKYGSPQRILSKVRQRREKSPKFVQDDLTTQDPVEISAEGSTLSVGNYHPYEQTIIGVYTPLEPTERKQAGFCGTHYSCPTCNAMMKLTSRNDSSDGFCWRCRLDGKVESIVYSSLAGRKRIPSFLNGHPCYDVMPKSGKVIVLSVELLVKNAFKALVTNNIKSAPLWDKGECIGMLTISDFINVLRHYYYSSPEDLKDIENHSIRTWRKIIKVEKRLVKVDGMANLERAAKLHIQERVHRIPVFDEKRQTILFVMSLRKLLHFLSCGFDNFEKKNAKTPSFFKKTIGELRVGTFEDIVTVQRDTKVIDALDLFMERKVSALPIVNKEGVLLDIFRKFDVFKLAKEQTYRNLDMPISDAIPKTEVRETTWLCTLDETFGNVIRRFANNEVHRMVVTDEKRVVVGIISLSDIFKFILVNPLKKPGHSSTPETIVGDAEGAVRGSADGSSLQAEPESFESCPESPSDGNASLLEGFANLKIQVPKMLNRTEEAEE